jgi:hypothetical protein
MHVTTSRWLAIAITWLLVPLETSAQSPDTPEPGSIEAIAQETTDPRYLSSWVASVPDSPTVPSPTDFLGHIAGAADELPNSAKIYAYMRALAAASERVNVEVIGRTEEGREILLVAIADEAGIRALPQLKAATARFADPRLTSPAQFEAMLPDARPFYYFNGAIHADESGAPDMLMELAYRLAVSEEPMIQRIRKQLVVLINPVANPDGRDKMSDWFYRFHRGKTDYDTLARQSPPYWGKYVFVDANRDAHQLDFETTRAVAKMFFDYHPTVIHDLHEAIPLLQTWNGTGPYNPHLDPIVYGEFLEMSFHEMSALSTEGMPGVWTWDFGEAFGHHYTDSIAMNHNSIGRGYETFGNAVPLRVTRKLSSDDVSRKWYRPYPPPEREFVWSHRDDVNYSQSASLAALDYSAGEAKQLLRSFYQKGYNSWTSGKSGDPYAFVIPAEQGDRLRVASLINRLLTQHIEVSRARAKFSIGDETFAAGDFFVMLDQPYRNYAVDLLEPQEFPKNAEHEPYDDISWSLPIHYGVRAVRVDDAGILKVSARKLVERVQPKGTVESAGSVYLLRDTGQEALLAARYRLADFEVEIAEHAFRVGRQDYPAGSWVMRDQPGLAAALQTVSDELALDFDSARSAPDVPRHAAPLPRLGIWVPWADTDMIGWIRYSLDQQRIPYTYLRDEEIRAGNLKQSVDVIVYGTVLLDLQGQIHGIEPKQGPMPFDRTEAYPSLGYPVASDDITGGIGWSGLANLEAFARDGGVLITLGSGSTLVLESGLVRNVKRAELPGVTTPGAHLRTTLLQPEHPLAYGYPTETYAFRSPFSFYDPPRRWLTMSYCTSCLTGPIDMRHVVMQWGTLPFDVGDETAIANAPPIVISGGGKNPSALEGRPALLDVPLGKGDVLVYNFNPMHRDMNHHDCRYLYNGILNWRYITSRRPEGG